VDVVLLRWPHEQGRREDLQRREVPRLLLVDSDHPAPVVVDCFEDWVRLPATDEDIDARSMSVLTRAAAHLQPRPMLDPDGVLRSREDWVSLPPVEARLMAALLDRFGAVVSREQLSRAGWPAGAPGRNALDVHMLRLRRRIAPLSLVIKTVRSRGYLLERGEESGSARGNADASDVNESDLRKKAV
jgi:DNA-binding winged helix-turn-helix (wHTH) protein